MFSNMVIIDANPVFIRHCMIFNILTTPKTTAKTLIYLYIFRSPLGAAFLGRFRARNVTFGTVKCDFWYGLL